MTILVRVTDRDFELTVCGTPSKAWLDWLATTTVLLTEDQLRWRGLGRATQWQRPAVAPQPQFDLDDADDDGQP